MKKLYSFLTLLCSVSILLAQTSLEGIVISSEKQEPLEAVRIEVKNTNSFTTTDKKGYYEITLPATGSYDITSARQLPANLKQKPILIFSLDGFASVEKVVEKSGQLDVTLPFLNVSDFNKLPDTKTATSSIGRLSGHQLLQPYIGNSLNGKVVGVQTFPTGNEPGQDAVFQLRGINSIASSRQPLVVMDGIWLNDSDLADIVPEDIAHVEILKGAASTAEYGSRGGNGVIKLTSRRGRDAYKGRSRIIFRSEYGFSQPTNRYDLNSKTNREILSNSSPQPVLGNPNVSNTFINELPALKDYQEDLLFQNGAFNAQYLVVENNSSSTNFLASVQHMNDIGILQFSDGYTRNALRFNLDHQLNEKWQFCAATAYTFSKQDVVETGMNGLLANTLLLTPIFDLDVPNEEDGSSYDWDIDNTGNGIINPRYRQTNSDQHLSRNRLLGNWTAKYQLTDAIQFRYSALLDRSTTNFEQFLEKGFLSSVLPERFSSMATFGVEESNGGAIFQDQMVQQSFLSQAAATLDKKIGGLDLKASLSYQYEKLNSDFESKQGENLVVSKVRSLDNVQSNILVSSYDQDAITHSGTATIQANYKEKYSFNGAIRQERSSLFGTDATTDYFYQTGLAYRLSQDIKIKGIQELKLRAAMGTAGIRPTFEQRFSDFRLLNGTVRKNILENSSLRPTLVEELELGADLTFARAFDLRFSYIKSTAKDQILLMPLSGGTGFEGQWQNAGTLNNTIYEADLNIDFAQLFRMGDTGFRWDIRTIFSKTNSTIATLNVPAYDNGLYHLEEGQELGVLYGNVFATSPEQLENIEGFDPADYAINELGYLVREDMLGTPEEVAVKVLNDDGKPLLQEIGNATPDFRMSFSNSLSFRGFELYALWNWKKGGDLYNSTKQTLYSDLRAAEVSGNLAIAAPFYESLYNDNTFNNHFIEDGSYLMLREVALSYTLNQPSFFNGVFERLQFSLVGRNLWTWTQYSGFHPEAIESLNGQVVAIDNFAYPSRRMLTGSVKVIF